MILHGKIQSGLGIGKKMGFPTVNLFFEKTPDFAYGVYAAYASALSQDEFLRNKFPNQFPNQFPVLIHFGPRPTIQDEKLSFEVFFLKFPEGVEFHELEVEILGKIRDVMKFDSLEDLAKQIEKDREKALVEFFGDAGGAL